MARFLVRAATELDVAEIIDGCGIDFVVFGVSAEEFDVDNPCRVIDVHDQSVLVAFDVEDDAVVSNWSCIGVAVFDVKWIVNVQPPR